MNPTIVLGEVAFQNIGLDYCYLTIKVKQID